MEFASPEIAGFVGGLLLCAGIVATVMFQVRHLLISAAGEGEGGGRPKGLRAFLMIALLALKTFGAGVGVWLLIGVWRLPIGAIAFGLFGGLAVTVVGAILFSWQAQKKSAKKH